MSLCLVGFRCGRFADISTTTVERPKRPFSLPGSVLSLPYKAKKAFSVFCVADVAAHSRFRIRNPKLKYLRCLFKFQPAISWIELRYVDDPKRAPGDFENAGSNALHFRAKALIPTSQTPLCRGLNNKNRVLGLLIIAIVSYTLKPYSNCYGPYMKYQAS